MDCPVFALVCDFERADGFEDFVAFFPEGQRRRFLGQKFPLVPDLDPQGRIQMVESSVQWVGNNLFPTIVYKNWAPEDTKITASRDDTSANVRLYRFLWQMRERQRQTGAHPDSRHPGSGKRRKPDVRRILFLIDRP